jgi:hypothetical protein
MLQKRKEPKPKKSVAETLLWDMRGTAAKKLALFEKLKARGGSAGEDRVELLTVERMLRTFAATEKRLTVSGRSKPARTRHRKRLAIGNTADHAKGGTRGQRLRAAANRGTADQTLRGAPADVTAHNPCNQPSRQRHRRRSVFGVVEDAFPARFDGREQPLHPYRCSNAASETDNECRHPFSLASYHARASAACMRWH